MTVRNACDSCVEARCVAAVWKLRLVCHSQHALYTCCGPQLSKRVCWQQVLSNQYIRAAAKLSSYIPQP